MGKTYVGDIGTKILLDSSSTLTGATVKRIYYRKPLTGTTGHFDAEIEDTTKLYYTTDSADDLDEAGDWILQIYVETATWTGHGEECTHTIYEPETS